jgi:hypothetical protein
VKRHTVILPLLLPRLTDKAAAQFIEWLHQLIAAVEHHYAAQIHRHQKRRREIQHDPQSPPSSRSDIPF